MHAERTSSAVSGPCSHYLCVRRGARAGTGAVVVALVVLAAGCGGETRTPGPAPSASVREGLRVFVRTHCGSCHTLAAARTHGRSGPDFDTSEKLDRAQIHSSLLEGANGMPTYAGHLNQQQLTAVAEFLFQATHHPRGR